MSRKFDDCATCRHRRREAVCRDCGVGELYEDEEAPGVDSVLCDPDARPDVSVTGDDDRVPDAQRFIDNLPEAEPDDGEDDA